MVSLSLKLNLQPISLTLSPPIFAIQLQSHPSSKSNGGTPVSFVPPAKARSLHVIRTHCRNNSNISANSVAVQQEDSEEEEKFEVLTSTQSEYNKIVMLESKKCKVLLLDDSGNVHSILYKNQIWSNSYWDEFCSLPAMISKGPVGIFGLGGGTVAHQLLHFWPSLVLHGWEVDHILIDRARMYFGMSELEISRKDGGILQVCVGDALSPSATVAGGYAGIIVDLFSNAEVLPELEVATTWLEMRKKLMYNGRIMVNCGGAVQTGTGWQMNPTIQALCEAFGGEFVNWKKMPDDQGGNYMAFTGPLPDMNSWSDSVPDKLRYAVNQWRPCHRVS